MTTSFFLIFSEYPWEKLRANIPHLQFLANNCVYRYQTVHYCLYRHTTVLIHKSLYVANQLWCSDFLYSSHTSHHPSQTPCLPWISYATQKLIHARCSKSSLKHSIRFCGIFPSLNQNFIEHRSCKVSSPADCLFWNSQAVTIRL